MKKRKIFQMLRARQKPYIYKTKNNKQKKMITPYAPPKEPILEDNKDRFVIFPIQHNDIWEFYKQHQQAFWIAEEVDLTDDVMDWEDLSDNERSFIKQVLAFFAASDK